MSGREEKGEPTRTGLSPRDGASSSGLARLPSGRRKSNNEVQRKSSAGMGAKRSSVREITVAEKLSIQMRNKYKKRVKDQFSDWSTNHVRLLYMISRYSRVLHEQEEHEDSVHTMGESMSDVKEGGGAEASGANESWVRRLPLLVLLYEGIVAQIFDFDYAPSSEGIGTTRVYMNISQEGRDAIDDLREGGLVSTLTVASTEYETITAYQANKESWRILDQMSDEEKHIVNTLVYAPVDGGKSSVESRLMEVFWDAGQTKFVLCASNGFAKASSVTEVEDVSYVCSPYIPSAARGGHIIFDMPMNNKDVARQVNGLLSGWYETILRGFHARINIHTGHKIKICLDRTLEHTVF